MMRCGSTPRRRDRRLAPSPTPGRCLTPLAPISDDLVAAALRHAGCVPPPAPLIELTGVVARRARSMRAQGLSDEEADRVAVANVDFDSPRITGPLIVSMPQLDGGRREIEAAVRALIVAALRRLR